MFKVVSQSGKGVLSSVETDTKLFDETINRKVLLLGVFTQCFSPLWRVVFPIFKGSFHMMSCTLWI